MKYGLTENELKSIQRALSPFPNLDKAVLFGSRALGTNSLGSDIDLAVYGDLTFNEFLEMKIALEKTGILQELDVVRFESIDTPELVDHIEGVGVRVYLKEVTL